MAGFWSTLVVVIACLLVVDATRITHKHVRHGHRAHADVAKRAAGKAQFGYFTPWGNLKPADTDAKSLTHILYAFAGMDGSTGVAKLTDPNSDIAILKQLYQLKQEQRHLKILLSIGGGLNSRAGQFAFVTTPSKRTAFVDSVVTLIGNYGLDGADIDFEYPGNDDEGDGFASLLTELRAGFDKLASSNGDSVPYVISTAVSAVSYYYQNLKISKMDSALDFWNLMAYDYTGPWSKLADNQSNLYGGARTGISTDEAVKYYIANGATASKINIGIPLYGYAFTGTAGLGKSYEGMGSGDCHYSELPYDGAQVTEDTTDIASYSYDSSKEELVTFDTPNIVKKKCQYILSNGLAGTMYWQLSGDKVGAESLVATAANELGTLDQTPNHISYSNLNWGG